MRQWKTSLLNNTKLDDRTRDEILAKMKELAASYTPEWQFDVQDPDIGSCIALLYADEMAELIRRYNTVPERNCVEMVNFLNIFLKPAYPAHSIVLMDVIDNTVRGVKLPKGIKLLADSGSGNDITFETANGLYLTNAKIRTIFMTSGLSGSVYPITGEFPRLDYIEPTSIVKDEDEEEFDEDFIAEGDGWLPWVNRFALFDFDGPGYGLRGMLLYHTNMFDVNGNDIFMELKGGSEIADAIVDGSYRFQYLTADGFRNITDITRVNDECISFRKNRECAKTEVDGVDYSVLLIEPIEPVTKNITLSGIGFSSEGKPQQATNVWDGDHALEIKEFYPFGEVMSTYTELYIAHEEYFTKPGALVTVDFNLDFGSKLVSPPKLAEDERLKIIKKRPRRDVFGAPAEVFADEVVIEYFNGLGWKKLETKAPVSQLFQNNKAGKCRIEFICPQDWNESEEGSEIAHWIRFRLLRAENCYYQPALHHYPIIRDLTIAYSYMKKFEGPQKLICCQGRRKKDMTVALAKEPRIAVFSRNPYNKTSLYIGLDKRIEDGPVSIMIDVDELEGYSGRNIKYYYSTRRGFARLKLIDNTDGLEHTGTLVFMPPTDMSRMVLEGQERYWIRITDERRDQGDESVKCPIINDIRINAVEVNNVDTLSEQDYYIDRFGPNMTFALNADKILSVDVWVNEIDNYTESEMRTKLIENPTETKAEYGLNGEIDEFYVKWQEVDNFDLSEPSDRHYMIDRQNNTIVFGDGVHVQIPKNTTGIAFKTSVRCCDGKAANVPATAIHSSKSNLMFVNAIYNPKPAFGGMDMETFDDALRRGATQLGNRNRLISAIDYEKEVLNFSNSIIQTKTVVDVLKDGGKAPGAISVVILMEDFMDGPESFLKMRDRLKEHMLEHCELSVDEKHFDIVQPIFVRVSAQLWVRLVDTDDGFDVQQHLIGVLRGYLNPIRNDLWDIGRMATESQIGMQLNIEKGSALIERVMLSASYEDENGFHEVDLDALKGNPYVLVMNGTHQIHFL